MYGRRWEQLGAATGIVFVVLIVIGFVVAPEPPQVSDTPAKVAAYFSGHQNAIQATNFLTMLAAFFFVWFLGSLRSLLRLAEGGTGRLSAIAFGGGLVAIAFAGLAAVAATVGAYRVGRNPDVLQMLNDVSMFAFVVIGFAAAAYLEAASVVMIRSRLLPSGLGYAGALFALIQLLSLITLFGATGGAFNPRDGAVGLIAFLTFLAWTLAVSALLVIQAGRTRVEQMPPPAEAAPPR